MNIATQPLFDFGMEDVQRFDEIAFYGHLWLVEFRDYTRAIVIEDGSDAEPNYVLTPDEIHPAISIGSALVFRRDSSSQQS